MTLAARLVHRCTITRPTGGHSWDSEGTDPAHLTNQPCFYSESSTRENRTVEGNQATRLALLFLPADTDVTKDDRVSSVLDEKNRQLLAAEQEISGEPIKRRTHIECVLTGATG